MRASIGDSIMIPTQVAAFLRQPSTVLGIATVLGTLSSILTGQLTWIGAIPPLVGAAFAIAVRDNTATVAEERKQVVAATSAVVAAAEAATMAARTSSPTTVVAPIVVTKEG